MKRRNMISFFTLLFITILVISFFIILVGREKRALQKAAEEASDLQITSVPEVTQAPTDVPEPTIKPTAAAQLYPAYQMADQKKKYGYINVSGDFIITPAFDTASDFCDGAAVVTMDGENLVIDEKGKILYNNSTTISDFANGAAVFSEGSGENTLYGYIDTKGKTIIKAQYDYAEVFRDDNTAYVHTTDGAYSLIDKTGKVLESYQVNKKYEGYGNFHDGYLIYSKIITKNDNPSTVYGVVNVKGDEILKPIYSQIRYLGGGFFAATKPGLEPFEAMAAKEALFNQSGEQLSDYSYYTIGNLYNGYMSATDDSTTFFIDTTGNKSANLPEFDGIGTMVLNGDVIEATIDGQVIYSTPNKLIFWQEDLSIELSDSLVVNTLKYRLNRFALVKYPQVEGIDDSAVLDSINQTLQALFLDNRKNTTLDASTGIEDSFTASLLGNLLIFERTGYDYPFGAAHGMPIMDYFYIDIKTGAAYQLKDLFLEDHDYTAKLTEMITSEITANLASSSPMYFPESEKALPEIKNFKLDKDSITIYFYPYDIAPYAAGFPEFLIPFKDISEYINKEGGFWKSFNE